jgi:hypothetical protein
MPKCRVCKEPATKRFGMVYACGFDHAVEWANENRASGEAKRARAIAAEKRKAEREERRALQQRRESVRSTKWHLDKCQKVFNEYIRKKNFGASCISCGAPDSDRTHQAGHFRPAGINTALRFTENNCWPQCLQCNLHKSGNVSEYRRRLSSLIGEQAVIELESNNQVKRWSIDELIEIRRHYQQKLKELRQ